MLYWEKLLGDAVKTTKKIYGIDGFVDDLRAKGFIDKRDKVVTKGYHATIYKEVGFDRYGWMEDVVKSYKGDMANRVVHDTAYKQSHVGRLKLGKYFILVKPNNPKAPKRYENEQVNYLNRQLKEKIEADYLLVTHNGDFYRVKEAVQITNPKAKADIALVGVGKHSDNERISWISHKSGTQASMFQGYAGISQRNEPKLYAIQEVKSFEKALKKNFPKGMKSGDFVAYDPKDKDLGLMAIFGHDFGSSTYGENNVNWFVQGMINFKFVTQTAQGEKVYTIEGSANTIVNVGKSNTKIKSKDPYEPILASNYRTDRNNFGITHSRSGVMQRAFKNADKNAKWLKKL